MDTTHSEVGRSKVSAAMLKQSLLKLSFTKGWPYITAWAHRITGVLLVVYICFHIITLSSLFSPQEFDAKMQVLKFLPFVLLEWILAIPVVFHALNGGRLILYEAFGNRKDDEIIRWVVLLSVFFLIIIGFVMMLGNQTATYGFFWLSVMFFGCCTAYIVWDKIKNTRIGIFWKLQRITGAFLFIAIPAHMLFMHLDPAAGHESGVIIARMGNLFIKIVDILIVSCVLFHGGYGLISIMKDYVGDRTRRNVGVVLIIMLMAFFLWKGVRLAILV